MSNHDPTLIAPLWQPRRPVYDQPVAKKPAMTTLDRRRGSAKPVQAGPRKNSLSVSPATRFSKPLLWVTIFSSIFAAYLPALHGGMLWDDSSHVTGTDLQSLHGLWRIWSDVHATQQYYPLLHSAFWLEHRLWGDAVEGYHLTNLALHAVSACLVVLIMRRLSLPGAWLAGFVFALHPVHVESVAWISEQKSTLSGVFYLASLLTYLHFDQNRRKTIYSLATGLFLLALLSKTVTATLPAVLLLIFWWRRGHLEWKRDVAFLLPWFALGISSGLFTAWVERSLIGASGRDFLLTPPQRVLIAGRVIFFYFGKLLWPANLMFFYPHWNIDPSAWWQWLFPAGVLTIGIGLTLATRRNRGPLTGFLVFSGTLFPVLGFLNVYPFRYSYVADHFQYLASLGIIIPVVALLAKVGRLSSAKNRAIAGSVLLVLVLGILTWRQSRMYRDLETLYRTTLARNPASWAAHNNLGMLLAENPDQLSYAMEEYQAALRIRPDYAEAHNNVAKLLAATGRLSDAIAEFNAALQINPELAEAHYNLGTVLAEMPDRRSDAISEFRTALHFKPDFAEAHYNLGIALVAMPDRLPDAIAEYRAALAIKPNFAEAHYNLGVALAAMPGRLPDAIAEYQAALRIKPNYAEAHMNLGNALSEISGRLPDAIEEYQVTLQIRPDYAEAHTNLAVALSRTPGRLEDAIAEFRAALRINPDLAEAHLGLGDALSGIGMSEEALAEYKAALRLKPDYASLVSEQMKRLRAPQLASGK